MPKREIMLSNNYNGWFNDKVRNAIEERDQCYKQYLLNLGQNEWVRYEQYRNRVVSTSRYEKNKYYEENIDLCRGNAKEMWKTLKEITGQKLRDNIKVIEIDGEEIED
ncbi:hypothetical protein JTB14_035745 [Gonioctena quinquepunctata]|nr:hypothetical protein JTB14_035745 [Gonioctena quinquepunctata]